MKLRLPEGDCPLPLLLAYTPVFPGPLELRKPLQEPRCTRAACADQVECLLRRTASLFPQGTLSYFLTGQAWTPCHSSWTAVDAREETGRLPIAFTRILSIVSLQPDEGTLGGCQPRKEAVDSRRMGSSGCRERPAEDAAVSSVINHSLECGSLLFADCSVAPSPQTEAHLLHRCCISCSGCHNEVLHTRRLT